MLILGIDRNNLVIHINDKEHLPDVNTYLNLRVSDIEYEGLVTVIQKDKGNDMLYHLTIYPSLPYYLINQAKKTQISLSFQNSCSILYINQLKMNTILKDLTLPKHTSTFIQHYLNEVALLKENIQKVYKYELFAMIILLKGHPEIENIKQNCLNLILFQ